MYDENDLCVFGDVFFLYNVNVIIEVLEPIVARINCKGKYKEEYLHMGHTSYDYNCFRNEGRFIDNIIESVNSSLETCYHPIASLSRALSNRLVRIIIVTAERKG